MNMSLLQKLLLWSGIGLVLIVALMLTILPGYSPLIYPLSRIFADDMAGAAGHAGLFGILTTSLYIGLVQFVSWRRSLLLAMGCVLVISTATEIYQADLIQRSSTIGDLLGNWLGVFIAGFSLSMFRQAGMSITAKGKSRGLKICLRLKG